MCNQPVIIGAQGGVPHSGFAEELLAAVVELVLVGVVVPVVVLEVVPVVVDAAPVVDEVLAPCVVGGVELDREEPAAVLDGLVALLVLEPCGRIIEGATKKTTEPMKITITATAPAIVTFDTPRLFVIMSEASLRQKGRFF